MAGTTALLVIDVQNGVLNGKYPCVAWEQVVERVGVLLARARAANVPVVYVQDDDVGPEGSEPWQIHAAVAPQAGEPVVRKRASDAFYGTDLHQRLQQMGVTQLVVAGAKSQYCVESACRRATTLGYNVVLVGDAHTTSDTPVLAATGIIEHVNWTMDGFDNLENYVEVKPLAEVDFTAL